jgi:hypothetical protein
MALPGDDGRREREVADAADVNMEAQGGTEQQGQELLLGRKEQPMIQDR